MGKNQPIPFIVGGSYGAAVEAFRRTNGAKCLAYNDIDVWYKSLDDEDDGKDEILQVHYERDVFPDHPDMEVNVIRLGKLQLRALIEDFDTNNVQVGYKVVPRIEDGRLVAEVADTYVSAAFEDFLQTWTIRIVNPMSGKTRATTLIRLLYKAQQLDLPYDLPPEKEGNHICLIPTHGPQTGNKCHASSNKCLTSSNKGIAIRNKCLTSSYQFNLDLIE